MRHLASDIYPMYEHILFDISDKGVATITLNRPEVYNAINEKIAQELQDAFKTCGKDKSVRAVVLSGGAGKAFCSGQDLKEGATQPGRSLYDSIERKYNPLVRLMRGLPKPIIARVQGVAAGAGASIALAADIVVAAEETYFAQLFINIGLVPDTGSSYFLPRLVGAARAFEICATGRRVSAKEAHTIGMIAHCVPLGALDDTVAQLADDLAARPTATLGLLKKLLQESYSNSLDQMLEKEALYQEAAGQTHDHKEGVQAFLEKRAPVFTGN
jgi:2-(1,2-epoxy-1,2-dihydrophenyl)acetyl-CoA isomerase